MQLKATGGLRTTIETGFAEIRGDFAEMRREILATAIRERIGHRRGSLLSLSSLSTFDGDNKDNWRGFRRDLLSKGFRSRTLDRHRDVLIAYMMKIDQGGLLDKAAQVSKHPELMHNPWWTKNAFMETIQSSSDLQLPSESSRPPQPDTSESGVDTSDGPNAQIASDRPPWWTNRSYLDTVNSLSDLKGKENADFLAHNPRIDVESSSATVPRRRGSNATTARKQSASRTPDQPSTDMLQSRTQHSTSMDTTQPEKLGTLPSGGSQPEGSLLPVSQSSVNVVQSTEEPKPESASKSQPESQAPPGWPLHLPFPPPPPLLRPPSIVYPPLITHYMQASSLPPPPPTPPPPAVSTNARFRPSQEPFLPEDSNTANRPTRALLSHSPRNPRKSSTAYLAISLMSSSPNLQQFKGEAQIITSNVKPDLNLEPGRRFSSTPSADDHSDSDLESDSSSSSGIPDEQAAWPSSLHTLFRLA